MGPAFDVVAPICSTDQFAASAIEDMLRTLPGWPVMDRPGGDRQVGTVKECWVEGDMIMARLVPLEGGSLWGLVADSLASLPEPEAGG